MSSRSERPSAVAIREVGPRDGLQSEQPLAPASRAALVDQLAGAGCRWIEAVSFVSPKAVPAMAGAEEVVSRIAARDRIRLTALVPNLRGAQLALAAGVDEITVTIAASPTYNERNVHRSVPESLAEIERICQITNDAGIPVDAVVSCAFGSPYEGDVTAREVAELSDRLVAAGAAALTLADTTGMATPRVLRQVLACTGVDVGLHLHETRGTALLNAFVALEAGVARFDTSVGGLGGSPFAEGAGGNLATESLVALLDDLDIATGIDLEALIDAAKVVEGLVGHTVPSPLVRSGPRTRLAGSKGT